MYLLCLSLVVLYCTVGLSHICVLSLLHTDMHCSVVLDSHCCTQTLTLTERSPRLSGIWGGRSSWTADGPRGPKLYFSLLSCRNAGMRLDYLIRWFWKLVSQWDDLTRRCPATILYDHMRKRWIISLQLSYSCKYQSHVFSVTVKKTKTEREV